MTIIADEIYKEIKSSQESGSDDPFVITPLPDLDKLKGSGAASVDLRLGSWFLTLSQARVPALNVYDTKAKIPSESKLTNSHYVPIGESYILHPKAFVLGITLEWIRLPIKYSGYVVGRSSWGRHGLIIATATGIHPGFSGCLTLELTNVGEIPITIKPGTAICQLFIHRVTTPMSKKKKVDISLFFGRRKPVLGAISLDKIIRKLAKE